jgi:hypothetical protein
MLLKMSKLFKRYLTSWLTEDIQKLSIPSRDLDSIYGIIELFQRAIGDGSELLTAWKELLKNLNEDRELSEPFPMTNPSCD